MDDSGGCEIGSIKNSLIRCHGIIPAVREYRCFSLVTVSETRRQVVPPNYSARIVYDITGLPYEAGSPAQSIEKTAIGGRPSADATGSKKRIKEETIEGTGQSIERDPASVARIISRRLRRNEARTVMRCIFLIGQVKK